MHNTKIKRYLIQVRIYLADITKVFKLKQSVIHSINNLLHSVELF